MESLDGHQTVRHIINRRRRRAAIVLIALALLSVVDRAGLLWTPRTAASPHRRIARITDIDALGIVTLSYSTGVPATGRVRLCGIEAITDLRSAAGWMGRQVEVLCPRRGQTEHGIAPAFLLAVDDREQLNERLVAAGAARTSNEPHVYQLRFLHAARGAAGSSAPRSADARFEP